MIGISTIMPVTRIQTSKVIIYCMNIHYVFVFFNLEFMTTWIDCLVSTLCSKLCGIKFQFWQDWLSSQYFMPRVGWCIISILYSGNKWKRWLGYHFRTRCYSHWKWSEQNDFLLRRQSRFGRNHTINSYGQRFM